MANETELIKEKLDLVDVVKSYIDLKKAGKNFKGICPFHQEEDPSFVVSPARQIWHCFGCGKGGDLIEFVKLYEGMDFPETLRFLAKKAGIPMKNISSKSQKKLDALYDINEEAKNFYKKHLQKNDNVKKYLKNRGLDQKTIEEFELGFAPGDDSLTVHLLDKGFDIKNIVKSGLAFKRKRGMHRDKFQRRLMFPIINEIEKTVAFTGRISPKLEKESDAPKYINSPETPIYKKSKILYGLYKSKSNIVDSDTVFIVEGQMDFLMVWQAGVRNLVSTSGTGLTHKHLNKLSRLADTVVLSFDNDSGGLRALERSIELFGSHDFHVKTVDLGEFSDPAEAVQNDPDFFKTAVENSRAAFDYIFEHYFEKETPKDIPEKKRLVNHLLKKIDTLESSVEKDEWIKSLANYSDISKTSLDQEMKKLQGKSKNKFSRDEDKESGNDVDIFPSRNRRDRISKRLLELAFTNDKLLPIVKENYKWFPKDFREVIDAPDSQKHVFLEMKSSFDIGDRSPEELKGEMAELLKQLKIEGLKMKQRGLRAKMKKDKDKKEEIASKVHSIARKIETLKRSKPQID